MRAVPWQRSTRPPIQSGCGRSCFSTQAPTFRRTSRMRSRSSQTFATAGGTRAYSDELLLHGCLTLYEREEDREWFANDCRLGASPAVAYALNRAFLENDLSEVLPAVRAPTLILYRRGSMGEAPALEVASQIAGARCIPVSGTDYFGFFLSFDIADEIERFVAGEHAPEVPGTVLATVLFTDIVASTERAAELGDRRGGSCSTGTTHS